MVYAREDLIDWYDPPEYILQIGVTDGVHDAGTHPLTVKILDLRDPPMVLNLDTTIKVPEDSEGGKDVFNVRGVTIMYNVKIIEKCFIF